MSPLALHQLTIALAIAGAALALGAALAKAKGWASPSWVAGFFTAGYLFMGLSVLLFILRGFWGDPG